MRSSDANTSKRDNTSSATRDDSPNANRERRTPSSDAAPPPKPPPLDRGDDRSRARSTETPTPPIDRGPRASCASTPARPTLAVLIVLRVFVVVAPAPAAASCIFLPAAAPTLEKTRKLVAQNGSSRGDRLQPSPAHLEHPRVRGGAKRRVASRADEQRRLPEGLAPRVRRRDDEFAAPRVSGGARAFDQRVERAAQDDVRGGAGVALLEEHLARGDANPPRAARYCANLRRGEDRNAGDDARMAGKSSRARRELCGDA